MLPKLALAFAAAALTLHGLIHLMGTAAYMRLAHVQGLPYKTTLLGGRLDLGEGGIRIFGACWMVPAVGFAAAAVMLVAGWESWRLVLVVTTLLSLALTGLDWSVAFAGFLVDVAILVLLWLGPRAVSLVA